MGNWDAIKRGTVYSGDYTMDNRTNKRQTEGVILRSKNFSPLTSYDVGGVDLVWTLSQPTSA